MKQNINTSPLTISDLETAKDIFKDTKLYTQNDVKERISHLLNMPENLCLKACINEDVIGLALCVYNGFHIFLSHIAVKESFQKQGIAKALLNNLQKQAKTIGAKGIITDAKTETTSFFTHLGFRTPGATFLIKDC